MRNYLVLMTAIALAACGGQGATTVDSSGSVPGPTGSGSTGIPTRYTDFTNLTGEHTYTAASGSQTYSYKVRQDDPGQFGQLYAGNATTLNNTATTISYSDRDGIYTLTTTDTKSGSSIAASRFQDPAHRVNFDLGIPNLSGSNVRYVASGSGTGQPYTAGGSFQETTLFYQVPGSSTKYVSFAGFQRLNVSTASVTDPGATVAHLEDTVRVDRGAFAYGVVTDAANVPKTGTGNYQGAMLASMVNTPGVNSGDPSYFQWIYGTSKTTVDFGKNSVDLALAGTVSTTLYDQASPIGNVAVPDGSTFAATGSGTLSNSAVTSGFGGTFTEATFTNGGTVLQHLTPPTSPTEVVNNRVLPEIVLASSTFDGNFFGPKGEEVGGSFRLIGGNPNQRIDIVGAFTGKGN